MTEQLVTSDGRAIDLDDSERVFAAAMAAPPASDPEMPLPPPVDPGAPYGRKTDGTPKKAPGGRPPKARIAPVPAAPAPPTGPSKEQPSTAQKYAAGIAEFLGAVELGLALVPIPNDNIRVHARYQSAVIEKTGDGLATGLGMAAEHNGTVRWAVEKITAGGAAWVFPAVMAIAPFAMSTAMLWKTPVTPEMAAAADQIEEKALAEFKEQMADLVAIGEAENKLAEELEAKFGPA